MKFTVSFLLLIAITLLLFTGCFDSDDKSKTPPSEYALTSGKWIPQSRTASGTMSYSLSIDGNEVSESSSDINDNEVYNDTMSIMDISSSTISAYAIWGTKTMVKKTSNAYDKIIADVIYEKLDLETETEQNSVSITISEFSLSKSTDTLWVSFDIVATHTVTDGNRETVTTISLTCKDGFISYSGSLPPAHWPQDKVDEDGDPIDDTKDDGIKIVEGSMLNGTWIVTSHKQIMSDVCFIDTSGYRDTIENFLDTINLISQDTNEIVVVKDKFATYYYRYENETGKQTILSNFEKALKEGAPLIAEINAFQYDFDEATVTGIITSIEDLEQKITGDIYTFSMTMYMTFMYDISINGTSGTATLEMVYDVTIPHKKYSGPIPPSDWPQNIVEDDLVGRKRDTYKSPLQGRLRYK